MLEDRREAVSSSRLTEAPSLLKHEHGKDLVKVELKNSNIAEFPLDRLGENNEFLHFIKQDELLRINTQEATLEEVFIQVTGKELKV
ncbi:MAG: hypothetical protein AAGI07_20190 [Bacteroidota bacterium]